MQAAIGVTAPFPGFVQPDEAKALHRLGNDWTKSFKQDRQ